MKKSKRITLMLSPVLGALLLTACGEEPSSRDVYQNQDECSKDWTSDLCEPMNEEDAREYRSSHGGAVVYPYYWGPRYYGNSRSVVYQGRTITPSGRSTTLAPYSITSRSSSSSRGGKSSPVSTGGFGGRSFSSGS